MKTEVKTYHSRNCDTYHIIPKFISMFQFKTAMDAIFVRGGPYCDRWGYYTPSDMSKLRALNIMIHKGVLQRHTDGSYLPTQEYMSLFCSAKRNAFYYWAGHDASYIERMVQQ